MAGLSPPPSLRTRLSLEVDLSCKVVHNLAGPDHRMCAQGIANWRWQGVPFFLRTGKRLPARLTEIAVVFRRPPVSIFQPYDECRVQANVLVLRLQPREGFELGFEVKRPGEGIQLATQHLGFAYADAFGPLHEAYETLLLDVMRGDQTLFVHAEEVDGSTARCFTGAAPCSPTRRAPGDPRPPSG